MKKWIITFSHDENTTKIERVAGTQPSMEQALAVVKEYADKNFEPLVEITADDGLEGPAQDLSKRYGITLTGIVERA